MKYNTLRVMQRKSDKNVRETGLGLKNKGWRDLIKKFPLQMNARSGVSS